MTKYKNGTGIKKEYYDDGQLKAVYRYFKGMLHCDDDKPSAITYFKNGEVRRVDFCKYNKFYRVEGPSSIRYYNNGQEKEILYIKNNTTLISRKNGPASQVYYKSGIKKRVLFLIDGNYHNENGTSVTYYNEHGSIVAEYYHLDNVEYKKIEWQVKLRKKKIVKINTK